VFHPGFRAAALRLAASDLDLLVVGGGITGCGIALDAAQRGLRVLLVEKGDIASGTSSRSSKLIHGGLRYLKQMQFRITRHACRERDRMLALNPHLVQPIRFLYPAWHGDRTPGWQVDLGLWMYDQLTGRPDKHTRPDPREVRRLAPALQTEGLDRVLAYSDAMADDARLTLAVAATAAGYGAGILTRCRVETAVEDADGSVAGAVVRDLETDDTVTVRARLVVNATGVWTDEVRERFGMADRRLRPSRGIHVILDRRAIPIGTAMSFPAMTDGRPVLLIPHPEGLLLGTTDHYHDGPLDDPRPTAAEVEYLLSAARAAFSRVTLHATDIRAAHAGLRPILDTHAENPTEASRDEDIWLERGVLSVAGGKLTTWRSMAEAAVDAAIEALPEERTRGLERCLTKGTPLAGLAPRDLELRLAAADVDPSVAAGMARRLAANAWPALALAHRKRDLRPLVDGTDVCAAEIRAHCRWGAVVRLEDLLLRRTRLGLWRPQLALEAVGAFGSVAAKELGWRLRRRMREQDETTAALGAWSIGGVVG
jgi:glycerol-3-phosphate dehydrogenase